eukprot:12612320-Prorocentrum_lima.AAC.1
MCIRDSHPPMQRCPQRHTPRAAPTARPSPKMITSHHTPSSSLHTCATGISQHHAPCPSRRANGA